jgi:ATP synthase protein I
MTTETMPHTPFTGVRVLLGSATAALVCGLLTVLIGGLVAGPEAAMGALAGTLLMVAVFGFGALAVNAVAGVLPSAALLVALLTYTLQIVLLAVVFWAVTTSPTLADELDRRWLGGAIIAATTGWVVTQIVLTVRQRIPAYDLPSGDSVRAATGGER